MPHQTSHRRRRGFSLFGLIAILAVIAILAAVITPMVFRQLMAARERATVAELARISAGLNGYFVDTGRYPVEAEGLIALVTDPGVAGWQGPYLQYAQEEPVAQVTTDAWNLLYAYDLNPATTPPDTAVVLVVSGGQNRRVDSGAVGGTWTVRAPGDDLIGLVRSIRANRENVQEVSREQERLGRAVQSYFADHQVYPTNLSDLSGTYLDSGIGSDALRDQWHRSYVLVADNAAAPPVIDIVSWGPDGVAGGADDVVLSLDSTIPGRKTTYYELAISQVVVDSKSGTPMSGNWQVDVGDFKLAPILATDGWGNFYEEQMSTRTVLSAGPDADYFTAADNIPSGTVPDDVALGGITYVAGSAQTTGGNCDELRFRISNSTNSPIVISSMIVTWSSPVAYYKEIKIDGKKVVKQKKPQVGSGEMPPFLKTYTLQPGANVKVKIKGFRDAPNKGAKVNMGNTDMTIEFSDESVITFNTGPC